MKLEKITPRTSKVVADNKFINYSSGVSKVSFEFRVSDTEFYLVSLTYLELKELMESMDRCKESMESHYNIELKREG